MADRGQGWPTQQNDSAIIDLGDVNDPDDGSDYETDVSKGPTESKRERSFEEDARKRLTDNVTQMVWNAGTQQAKRAWSLYGNIDILRPYFNVEPHEVRTRLLYSFIPRMPSSEKQRAYRELYGPLMVVFTLIALLLFQMKAAEHKVEEGTLMGTAFGVCFTYWWGTSALMWFLSYVCNAHITSIQLLSLLGYGLTGHCVVILLGTLIHTSHDHLFFYLLWAVFGGLSTLKMVAVIASRTHGKSQQIILSCTLAAIHLLFLLYLHFAYHQIVEDLSRVLDSDPIIRKPIVNSVKKVTENMLPKDISNTHLSNEGVKLVNKTLVNIPKLVSKVAGNKTH
ncbi:protein YIPF3-like isoform X1 [Saccostrea echinata]|uniref:protein YIPF3-like isoform X1 n=2 Tax=Saccostrea echinata TaxID=191078 RepID=UPI002A7F76A0|nr:protein YIPF3-like isoform X1 [Saccostrea echinata]